jgi:hypothetical protein
MSRHWLIVTALATALVASLVLALPALTAPTESTSLRSRISVLEKQVRSLRSGQAGIRADVAYQRNCMRWIPVSRFSGFVVTDGVTTWVDTALDIDEGPALEGPPPQYRVATFAPDCVQYARVSTSAFSERRSIAP